MSRTSVVPGILDISDESGKGQPRAVKDVAARSASRPFYSADAAGVGRHMHLDKYSNNAHVSKVSCRLLGLSFILFMIFIRVLFLHLYGHLHGTCMVTIHVHKSSLRLLILLIGTPGFIWLNHSNSSSI